MVKAITIIVDTDRIVGLDTDELPVVPHAWQLTLHHGIRVVLCHYKRKLASNILKLFLGSLGRNQDVVSLGCCSCCEKFWILSVSAFALGVTLDEAL